MKDALAIDRATVRFGDTLAVDNVSLNVPAGTTFGLVGESGSGKTTVMRAILGLQKLDAGSITIFDKVLATNRRGLLARAHLLQPIFQDPAASLSPRMRIRRLMEEVAAVNGETRGQMYDRLMVILKRLGVSESALSRYPHEISGGQARRVAIARVLLMQPKIIIADEPTAGLDVSVQGDLLNLLQDLRVTDGITLVVISHNLAVVRLISDNVAVMRSGVVVESGATLSIFDAPRHEYTRQLLRSWPGEKPSGGSKECVPTQLAATEYLQAEGFQKDS